MKVGLNELKKGLEASKAENQSLLSKEQQLLKKVQSCSEEIIELKGQLQVKSVIEMSSVYFFGIFYPLLNGKLFLVLIEKKDQTLQYSYFDWVLIFYDSMNSEQCSTWLEIIQGVSCRFDRL